MVSVHPKGLLRVALMAPRILSELSSLDFSILLFSEFRGFLDFLEILQPHSLEPPSFSLSPPHSPPFSTRPGIWPFALSFRTSLSRKLQNRQSLDPGHSLHTPPGDLPPHVSHKGPSCIQVPWEKRQISFLHHFIHQPTTNPITRLDVHFFQKTCLGPACRNQGSYSRN